SIDADLVIYCNTDKWTPAVGETVTLTVDVLNQGIGHAVGVTETGALPAGLTYVSHTVTQGTYVPASGTWNIGGLLNGSNPTLTITATVAAGSQGSSLPFAGTVAESPSVDPVPTDNTSSFTMSVP